MSSDMENKVKLEHFEFKDVPEWYPVCYQQECTLKDECMRYQAALQAPKMVAEWRCVLPSQLEKGRCPHFAEIQPIKVARGFKNLFDNIKAADQTPMRKELVEHFHGKRQYYWYLKGERLLSPKQQQWMRAWFRNWGYNIDVPFDYYEDAYYYTEELACRRFTTRKPAAGVL